jgi:hypothetical protein
MKVATDLVPLPGWPANEPAPVDAFDYSTMPDDVRADAQEVGRLVLQTMGAVGVALAECGERLEAIRARLGGKGSATFRQWVDSLAGVSKAQVYRAIRVAKLVRDVPELRAQSQAVLTALADAPAAADGERAGIIGEIVDGATLTGADVDRRIKAAVPTKVASFRSGTEAQADAVEPAADPASPAADPAQAKVVAMRLLQLVGPEGVGELFALGLADTGARAVFSVPSAMGPVLMDAATIAERFKRQTADFNRPRASLAELVRRIRAEARAVRVAADDVANRFRNLPSGAAEAAEGAAKAADKAARIAAAAGFDIDLRGGSVQAARMIVAMMGAEGVAQAVAHIRDDSDAMNFPFQFGEGDGGDLFRPLTAAEIAARFPAAVKAHAKAGVLVAADPEPVAEPVADPASPAVLVAGVPVVRTDMTREEAADALEAITEAKRRRDAEKAEAKKAKGKAAALDMDAGEAAQ